MTKADVLAIMLNVVDDALDKGASLYALRASIDTALMEAGRP